MVSELPVPLSFAAGGAAALGGTPLAIRLARRTGFFDHPRGYRSHGVSTPLLGGTAVLGALVLAAVVTGSLTPKLAILVTLASILWLLGTVDDRHPVAPIWRLIAEIAVAAALYDRGLGWKIAQTGGVQLAVTVIWVVTIVNALTLWIISTGHARPQGVFLVPASAPSPRCSLKRQSPESHSAYAEHVPASCLITSRARRRSSSATVGACQSGFSSRGWRC